jgi:phosphomannomutase
MAGAAIYGEAIQRLRRRMEAEDYASGPGRVARMDIGPEYRHRITSDCRQARPMKIVVDSGNGIPGASAPGILKAMGNEVIDLYSAVDGDFPNHHPDPSKPENLADLIKVVHATGAEIGLAFDGDGDRLGLVTRAGHIIYPDRQIMLFARDILARHRGATVIFDVKCSQRLPVAIRHAGGVPLMWKTGHSLIKAKLKETGAPFAGEMSGHLFFGERWYGFDDANPSALLDALPTSFSTPELNVACAEGEQHRAVSELLARAADGRLAFPGGEVGTIDGLRVDFDDGFGLIRASNTTPVLVLRFEGHTDAALHRIEGQMMAALRAVKPDAKVAAATH